MQATWVFSAFAPMPFESVHDAGSFVSAKDSANDIYTLRDLCMHRITDRFLQLGVDFSQPTGTEALLQSKAFVVYQTEMPKPEDVSVRFRAEVFPPGRHGLHHWSMNNDFTVVKGYLE